MSFHDAYARTTPLDLAFPEVDALRAAVERIHEEVETRGADVGDLGAFAMLVSVNSILRELGGKGASQEAILQHAALLFHAYHFARAEGRVYLVSTGAARRLVEDSGWSAERGDGEGGRGDGGRVHPPAPAGYVQLPRHLFWVHGDPSGPAEAVDGFFWTSPGGARGREEPGSLHLLLATGIRDGRPGLTVAPLPEVPLEEASGWLSAPCRPEGDDFANTLPGGEMEGLLAFTTAGEVFKLAARMFAYIMRKPWSVVPGADADAGAAPAPSRFPFVRIVGDGEEAPDA